jgi:hypothetical protein
MLHDAGFARFYAVEGDESGPPPHKTKLVEKGGQCFAEKTVGLQRFYEAAKVGMQADRLIEIWRDTSLTTRDLCRIEGQLYHIQQAAQGADEDGILVTRLTLQAVDDNVWEGRDDGDQD